MSTPTEWAPDLMRHRKRGTHGRFAKAANPHGGVVAGRIFDALCEHPYGLTCNELIERVYADREDGGPLTAKNAIVVVIRRMNKRWEDAGSCLRIRSRRNHFRYQIWIVR